jgi:hypothetical protein
MTSVLSNGLLVPLEQLDIWLALNLVVNEAKIPPPSPALVCFQEKTGLNLSYGEDGVGWTEVGWGLTILP